jgi:hypothetical protein
MKSISKLSASTNNLQAYTDLFKIAIESNNVLVVISQDKYYSYVTYNLHTIYPFVTLADNTIKKVIKMYENYTRITKVHKKHTWYLGSNSNMIFSVKRKDGEKFANKLLGYIKEGLVSV